MLFKNPVRTSKRTPHFSITKINCLTLFKEIIAVYSEIHRNPINAKRNVTDSKNMWYIYLPFVFKGLWIVVTLAEDIRDLCKTYVVIINTVLIYNAILKKQVLCASTLKTETVCSSDTLEYTYKFARHYHTEAQPRQNWLHGAESFLRI
jgi:hypothetical protein